MTKIGVLDSTRNRSVLWLGYTLALALLMVALSLPGYAKSSDTKGGRYDATIVTEVKERLSGKSEFQNVDVTAEDGIVNLEGSVDLLIDKMNAEKRARKVQKVSGVRNMISVQGPAISDSGLAEKLARKLRYDRIGQGIVFNNFTLQVQNGAVTLGGNVRTYMDRDSALAILYTIPGVKEVVDEVEVAPASNFDDELRVRTAMAVYGHPTLNKYAIDPVAPIRIVVDGGHVTLSGTVNSNSDRDVALMQARSVPGIFSVTDNLMVAQNIVR